MDLSYLDPNFVPVYSLEGIDAIIVAVCPSKMLSILAVELLKCSSIYGIGRGTFFQGIEIVALTAVRATI